MENILRARGALYGLAIGDALGMPAQMLSRAQIRDRWGDRLTGFEPAPPGHPIAAGMPAGSVTDDTEQAVLLGKLLVSGHGTIEPNEFASALVRWERDMAERGSLDLLGPSTKRAVEAVLNGTPPEEAGSAGTTNGAAMRITPVGIAVPLPYARTTAVAFTRNELSALVDQVVQASYVTHNTGIALAGAAAVAAAVSAGVGGATVAEATEMGIQAAHAGASRGHWVAGADVASRIAWAISSGVEASICIPCGASAAMNFGSDEAFLISRDSLSMIAGGVFAGANMPNHERTSNPGRPASSALGTFGSIGERSGAAIT